MESKFMKVAVLVLGLGVCVALALGVSIFLNAQENSDVPETIRSLSDFQKGDYYFNNDEDPAGPYDLVQARAYYKKAVAEDPFVNKLVWYQLGRIDFIEGKFDDALDKFAKQQEYFGDEVPNVYYMIGLTYGYKGRRDGIPEDWQKGQEAFEKFITFVPAAPWPRVDLAWLLFAQGKYEEMKQPLALGLAYRADNPWLLNMYGLALLNTDGKEAAAPYFQKAQDEAEKLTTQDWGLAYPGNDPDVWEHGLSEFKDIIQKNIALTQQ